MQQQQATVAAELANLQREQERQRDAERLFQLARRDRLELLDARLAVANQQEVVRQSRENLSNALLQLRNLIGEPGLTVTEIDPLPLRNVDPNALNEAALVASALESNPDLRVQASDVEVAERQADVARWEQWLPTVSLNATMSRTEADRGGSGAFFNPTPGGGWERAYSVSLNLPNVGQYLNNRNGAARQRLQIRNQQEVLRQTRLDVEQNVRSVLLGLRSDYAALGLEEDRVALAEERLRVRTEAYRLGSGTFQDLQITSDQAADARRQLLNRQYALELSLVDLEQTLGVPLERILEIGGS